MLPIQWRALRATKSKPIQAATAALFIVATVLSLFCGNVQAQNVTSFRSVDRFEIPQLNGSIRFAYNGTYSSATLENDTWYFSDLTLNGSSVLGNLRVSVQNSNINIYNLSAYTQTRQSVRYNAEGAGQQVFHFGLNTTTHHSEWWVTITGSVFLAEGRDWQLLPDNTVIVNGQTGNISVVHRSFGAMNDSNLPFYEKHSIALATAVAVAVTLFIAAVISIKVRKPKDGN